MSTLARDVPEHVDDNPNGIATGQHRDAPATPFVSGSHTTVAHDLLTSFWTAN